MLGNAFELPTDISSVDFAAKQPLRALPLPSPLPRPLLICLVALSQDFWSGSSGSVLCSAAVGGSRSRGGQDGERFSFRRKLTSSACWLQKLLGCHGAAFCWHLQGPNFITRRTHGFLLNPQCCLGKSTQGSTGDRKLEVSVCVCVCVWAAGQLCKQFAGHQSRWHLGLPRAQGSFAFLSGYPTMCLHTAKRQQRLFTEIQISRVLIRLSYGEKVWTFGSNQLAVINFSVSTFLFFCRRGTDIFPCLAVWLLIIGGLKYLGSTQKYFHKLCLKNYIN